MSSYLGAGSEQPSAASANSKQAKMAVFDAGKKTVDSDNEVELPEPMTVFGMLFQDTSKVVVGPKVLTPSDISTGST